MSLTAGGEPLALDRLFQQPGVFGTEPRALAWSPDGAMLAFLWAPPEQEANGIWLVNGNGDRLRRFNPRAVRAPREFIWRDQDSLLILRGAELRLGVARTGMEETIHTPGLGAHDLRRSPDGRYASYLRDGDLWVFDIKAGKERALTRIGIPLLSAPPTGRYSRAEREIGPGIWGGPTYAWAPDSKTIAAHHVDRRGMRKVPFPNYLAPETEPNPVRRGYPGDPNEARRVGLIDVTTASLRLLELPDPTAHQIVEFGWSPTGDLLIDTATDTATHRRIFTVPAGASTPRLLWENRRDTRIYTNFAARWSADGQAVIALSDHEDYYGLYNIPISGAKAGVPERLDNPKDDVLSAAKIAADGVFFEATAGKAEERQIFRLAPQAPAPQRLTQASGHHVAYPAPAGGTLAMVRSDDRAPPELFLLPRNADTPLRVTNSPTQAFADVELARVEYLTTPSQGDEAALHIRLLKPANFDESRRYPVLFGPMYSNTVRNRWGYAYTLMQQALTQRGYLVVQVDVRGSTGYGRDFREAFLNDFAGGDIEDIERAVAYLSSLPYVDGDRLGIWGSSYGGTLTVYTLLKKPGLFAAGVAAASAVDPAFFGTDDVAIVRRPKDESGIFDRRAEELVSRLQDKLLLVHGLQDQVVPFKTVASLTDAFIRAGKDVETVFIPGATHAWRREPPYDRYVFARLLEFFDRHLKGSTESAAP